MGKYVKIFIPNTLLGKEDKRRHKPRDWKHVYFFKGNRHGQFTTPVVEEWEPYKMESYNKNTLYKVKDLTDDLWDYYKILRTDNKKRMAQCGIERRTKNSIKKQHGFRVIHAPPNKPFKITF